MKRIVQSEIAKIIFGLVFFIPGVILSHIGYEYVSLALLITALFISGISVFIGAVKGILRGDLLDEKFLMSIASVGAFIIGEATEGVAVMLFFLIGEFFEHKAVRKSRKSIKELLDICPDTARVIVDGEEREEDAEDVEIGSTILVRPGERMPIDSRIISGSCRIDTSSLTGESMPRDATVGDEVDSGVVVLDGAVKCITLRDHSSSRASVVLELVENARERKSREENFITKFSRVYTPTVTALAVLMAVFPAIFGLISWQNSVYRALSFLVVSCPCALVISVPMAFFGGIGGAASRGILFKGGNVFSKVATVETIAFDKTGTITNGKFEISDVKCFDIDRETLLSYVASTEYASNHPIAECLRMASDRIIPYKSVTEHAGEGVVADFVDLTVAVGNHRLMKRFNIETDNSSAVYVAIDGRLAGVITISDKVKPEAKDAISALRKLGARHTYIFSGDREDNVSRVASIVGVDKAYSSLTPEEKFSHLESAISKSKSTMFVGDGINDSPSLARADVGVAMGSIGQDIAIEAADVVIMTDNLSKLPEAVKIARKTILISWQNIIFALGVKGLILLLGLFGIANMWLAVFADVGVAVLAILNSMRALKAPK